MNRRARTGLGGLVPGLSHTSGVPLPSRELSRLVDLRTQSISWQCHPPVRAEPCAGGHTPAPRPLFIHLQELCLGCLGFFFLVLYWFSTDSSRWTLLPASLSQFLQGCANWKLMGWDPP